MPTVRSRDAGPAARSCCFLAEPRADAALIGFCGLRDYEEPGGATRPELLYGLHPACWRQGHAFEASVVALRFGFEECALDRIDGGIEPPNERSRRVLERLGMTGWQRFEIGGLPADYASLTRAAFDAADHAAACYRVVG